MASNTNDLTTELLVARELGRATEPLLAALDGGPSEIRTLLTAVGFDYETAEQAAEPAISVLESHIEEPATVLRDSVLMDEPANADVEGAVDAIASVYQGIQRLDGLQAQTPDGDSAGEALFDYLLITYLERYHPGLHGGLSLLGVIDREGDPGVGTLRFSAVRKVLETGNDVPKEVFNWGKENKTFRAVLTLYYLKTLLWDQGWPAALEEPPPAHVRQLAQGQTSSTSQLRIPLVSYTHEGAPYIAGIKLVPLPGRNKTLPGIAVVAFGRVRDGIDVPLDGGWTFNVEASGKLGNHGITVQPTTDGTLETRLISLDQSQGSVVDELHGEVGLSHEDGDGSARPLLGSPDGTRVTIRPTGVTGTVDYTDGEVSLGVELPSTGRVVVSPKGGFLSAVMPNEVDVDFDTTVGWSMANGLYLEGGGKLSATLPLHQELGPLTIKELYGALDTIDTDSDLSVVGAVSPSLQLGPVTASVDRMGVSADVDFREDQAGNVGPLDLDVGFHPPSGVGLDIDVGVATGGGYMEFEPEHHRYSGTFQLTVGDYGIKVVGLLKTKLPGGRDGFSLLLLITGDFPPIQLGFGFTLNAVGGLAGLHREMKQAPLGKVVRSGNMDSILFPKDVVANAQQIISDLRSIFPPTKDVHVFGPMLKLGWGTPTMMSVSLGVVLAVPAWKIALLGRVQFQLPDEELTIIEFNVAVVGFLDIPGGELAVDGALYDSRMLQWTLSGTMAVRAGIQESRAFIGSFGGFHPRYSPPTSFPTLKPITASMSAPGGQPRIEYVGYTAVTPNTFQIGGGARLRAEAGPVSAKGKVSLDALLKFNPLSFVVDYDASFELSVKGKSLTMEIHGQLSGPKPLRVQGKISIKLLFVKVKAQLQVKIGSEPEQRELPVADVFSELTTALGRAGNWDAQRPKGNAAPVTLRDPTQSGGASDKPQGDEPLLVHPLGTVNVRQTVVPLGVTIEKYGNANPRNRRFELTKFEISGESLPGLGRLKEDFAPAKYRKLSDSEKLNSEAFEKLEAGRTFENDLCYYAGETSPDDSPSDTERKRTLPKQTTLEYESSIIDEAEGTYGKDAGTKTVAVGTAHELAKTGAVANSAARTTGGERYRTTGEGSPGRHSGGTTPLSVADDRYVVARTGSLDHVDMTGFGEATNPIDGQAQLEAREAMQEYIDAGRASSDALQVVTAHEVRSFVVVTETNSTRVDMSGVSGVTNPASGSTEGDAHEALEAYVEAGEVERDALRVVTTSEIGTPQGDS
jgi:hypothetical protein